MLLHLYYVRVRVCSLPVLAVSLCDVGGCGGGALAAFAVSTCQPSRLATKMFHFPADSLGWEEQAAMSADRAFELFSVLYRQDSAPMKSGTYFPHH